jgi:hypothetical protein
MSKGIYESLMIDALDIYSLKYPGESQQSKSQHVKFESKGVDCCIRSRRRRGIIFVGLCRPFDDCC